MTVKNSLPRAHCKLLLDIAKQALVAAVMEHAGRQNGSPPLDDAVLAQNPWLTARTATFVTLRRGNELRGCMGTVEARQPLLADLRHNASAAALHDPRFQPVGPDELTTIEVEVSLLSALEPLSYRNEAEAIAQLRPGEDGVLFEFRDHRSTFLPQVWESLPDPLDFLARLKQKAGLKPNFWHPEIRLYRYTVSKIQESDFA